MTKCKHRSQVCGINGKTYISECAAIADMVSVDYEGPCVAMGLLTNVKAKQCPGVKCPELQSPNCVGEYIFLNNKSNKIGKNSVRFRSTFLFKQQRSLFALNSYFNTINESKLTVIVCQLSFINLFS